MAFSRMRGNRLALLSGANKVITRPPEGTKLQFNQTSFPNDEVVSLAKGWHHLYWEPLAKVLA